MYTDEFLLQAFVSRFEILGLEAVESQYKLAKNFQRQVDRDTFRKYCSLDAQALNQYKKQLECR